MNRILLLCLIGSVSFINITKQQDLSVYNAFISSQIVPDMINQPPYGLAKVSYTSSGVHVNLGNELKPEQLQDQPTVSWDTEPGSLYTLTMTDPDAPSRALPLEREWKHWVVVNVPGVDVAAGEAVAEYNGPSPPPGTGFHRYVFLVYKQAGGRVQWCGPKLSAW
ncbi:protein D3 [Aedes aegypti]|uniref:Uncharacterized protein n=1 Tax=Aedes aegypti TaxID=7159 RepID=A0A903UNN6_AEDAE|nr:protein D3 [Aedes aegypti]